MGKSRFIELMAKSIGKTASEEELLELEAFLDQFPEYRKTQEVANSLQLEVKSSEDVFAEKDLNSGLSRLWDTIDKLEKPQQLAAVHKRRRHINFPFKMKWWAAAAIFIASFAGHYYYSNRSSVNYLASPVMRRVYVPFGKTSELVLPDGTRVRLNAGSTITYPQTFSRINRQVSLKGEGFFEVTKDHKKPFLVVTDHLTVKVLGTVFNVKAYPDDKNIETTLLRGKVQIELKNRPEKNIILLPNEKLVVMKDIPENDITGNKEGRIEYQLKKLPNIKPEEIRETAWLSNRIVFTNEKFEELAKQLERRYNVQMIFDDPALKNEQLSGVLEKESLNNALDIIRMTTPFKFRTEGRIIHILQK